MKAKRSQRANAGTPGPFLAQLWSYPVKGLPGVRWSKVSLDERGLPWDRTHVITDPRPGVNTTQLHSGEPIPWHDRSIFRVLARHGENATFVTQLTAHEPGLMGSRSPSTLSIHSPNSESIRIELGTSQTTADIHRVQSMLKEWFRPYYPITQQHYPQLAPAEGSMWDWAHTAVSFQNLSTLESISNQAGHELAVPRFRPNLVIQGLPAWAEQDLIGELVRIGGALLRIIQPTDRCRATSINPDTGEADFNTAAFLTHTYGHMFMGAYAQVVQPGHIAEGDSWEIIPENAPARLSENPGLLPDWPRTANCRVTHPDPDPVVAGREPEATEHLWLHDPAGLAHQAQPGQHIRLHAAPGEPPQWRNYTISAVRDDSFRVSIKPAGTGSQYFRHQIASGKSITITGPFGEPLPPVSEHPYLTITAGIGITPALRLAQAHRDTASAQPIRAIHIQRESDPQYLWQELCNLLPNIDQEHAQLLLTSPAIGRPAIAELVTLATAALAPSGNQTSHLDSKPSGKHPHLLLCGPAAFEKSCRDALIASGWPAHTIHTERFWSPGAQPATTTAAPNTGPIPITLAPTQLHTTWERPQGSLLDAFEAAGANLPSGCRAGVCGTCKQTLQQGQVHYLTEPLFPLDEQDILLCCSTPLTPVVIGHSNSS